MIIEIIIFVLGWSRNRATHDVHWLEHAMHKTLARVLTTLLITSVLLVHMRRQTVQRKIQDAELELLTDLAFAKKTFAQVRKDAKTFSYAGTELQGLVFSKGFRDITRRLEDRQEFQRNR